MTHLIEPLIILALLYLVLSKHLRCTALEATLRTVKHDYARTERERERTARLLKPLEYETPFDNYLAGNIERSRDWEDEAQEALERR